MIDSLRKTMCANVHNPIKNDYLKAFLSHRKHRLANFSGLRTLEKGIKNKVANSRQRAVGDTNGTKTVEGSNTVEKK